MKLVIDAMGSDNGSPIVKEAVRNFIQDNPNVELVVVGKENELEDIKDIARVVNADEVVPMNAGALEVMRMKNSSINVALRIMKEENADGVVSAGSTGAFLSASTLILKLIPGVKRAALVSPFPTSIKGKKVVILDIGANNENSPEELAQFALMGSEYCKTVLGVKNPNVYLLNNGTEEGKGSPVVKEAYKLFKNIDNFKGNIEAIIVCDFAPATLTLKENGSDRPYGENLKVNSQVTLPDCDVTCDKKFVGWSTSNAEPSNLMAAGSSYTMTETTGTLYAWFATETPGTTAWNKVSTVSVGEYVIINNSKYLPNTTTSSAPAQADAPTITDNIKKTIHDK